MVHHAADSFWREFRDQPRDVQEAARKAFATMKVDESHPSLHLKKVGRFWSARVGLHYRVLGVGVPDGVLWFWIGTHGEYDQIVR